VAAVAAADEVRAAASVIPAAHHRELALIVVSATLRGDPVDARMTDYETLPITRMDARMLV
jgi:hypothetical protein